MSRCSVELLPWIIAAFVPSHSLTSVSPPLSLLSPWSANRKSEIGLGPWTLCCSAAVLAPGYPSPRATKCIKKKCIGLKITACLCSWIKFWTRKIQRDQTSSWEFWGAWHRNSVRSKSRVLQTPPALDITKGVGRPPRPPLPSPPLRNKLAPPSGSGQTRAMGVCSHYPLLQLGS